MGAAAQVVGRLASLSQVGIGLVGDSCLLVTLMVGMIEGSHQSCPGVLGRATHAPLTDGFKLGAHGFKDANSGAHD